jgi:hypothetical protein
MKILLVFWLLALSTQAFANRAVVIVLEAPLLEAPSMHARVFQTLRKGDELRIDPAQFALDRDQLNGFWETTDRLGNTVFIPKMYVKLITHDQREFENSVSRFVHDPTDYRLEEPLPENYPLYFGEKRRSHFSFGIGTPSKATYNYALGIAGEEFVSRRVFQVGYQQNLHFDSTDRLYFGPFFLMSAEQVLISFDNDTRARESRGTIGAGPFLSYDFFRGHRTLLSLGGGFFINYNRHLLTYATRQGDLEERLFSGLSLSSRVASTFHVRDIFPKVNLVLGSELELASEKRLKAQSAPNFVDVWGNGEEVRIPLHVKYSLFVGFVSTY